MKQLKAHKTFEGQTSFWSHDSTRTGTNMKLATFVPAGDIKGCIIWLSGLSCTEENFISKAGAQRMLAHEQLMLIAPDTSPRGLDLPGEHEDYDFGSGASFYVDATTPAYAAHYQMYSYIAKELVELIQSHFQQSRISIMGHSMGGHGALMIGLRNPEVFCSVSAFAPICHPMTVPWGTKALTGYLGADRERWLDYDTCELLARGHRHPAPLLVHQGLDDPFLSTQLSVEDFEAAAQLAGQSLLLARCPGYDHSYYFISSFIEAHIRHHARYLQA